jgi:hypothetical protein
MSQVTTSMSVDELKGLIRLVVLEELAHLLKTPVQSILDDWRQQGPDDPAGDDLLLQEALAVIQNYAQQPEAWLSWEEFEAELDEAEAAGELPD